MSGTPVLSAASGARQHAVPQPLTRRPASPHRSTRANVLLVGNDEETIVTYRWTLQAAECEVVSAYSGRSALAVAAQGCFDLLLIDLRLPDIPGMDIVRQLRAEGITVPFILVSAYVTVPVAVEAMRLGAFTVLEKPVDPDDLVIAVNSAIDQSGRTGRRSHEASQSTISGSTAERWAGFVLRAIDCPSDPKTLSRWARTANVSRSVLTECCRLMHVPPHEARDFARTLRAVCRSGERWEPEALLDVADVRTLRKLFTRAGLVDVTHAPSPEEFFARQQWVAGDHPGLLILRGLLRSDRLERTLPPGSVAQRVV